MNKAFGVGKAYAPQMYPGRLRWAEVHVWDKHGPVYILLLGLDVVAETVHTLRGGAAQALFMKTFEAKHGVILAVGIAVAIASSCTRTVTRASFAATPM